MNQIKNLVINTKEKFTHFPNAPIIEAAIEIRAPATTSWEENLIQPELSKELSDYPIKESQRQFHGKIEFRTDQPKESFIQDLGWRGLIFRSADKKQVVQSHKDLFAFSRLNPYTNWEVFSKEALHLWDIHARLAQPQQIHRIGLRFINRILIPSNMSDIKKYFSIPPQGPKGLLLPFSSFLYQDTLDVSDTIYAINIIRTVQQQKEANPCQTALILDIDVFTKLSFAMNNNDIKTRLDEMRWLKNKVFFGSFTKKAKEMFK